jgi:hypothetical protein
VRAADAVVPPIGGTRVVVHVRNYARVPSSTFAGAEDVARTVFGRAGIAVAFRECPEPSRACAAPGPDELLLEVLGPRQCRALRSSGDVLGLAVLPTGGGRPRYAAVFLEKAAALARLGDASTTQVLGHAMAHEIGHLLLESGAHSTTGLMRARWSSRELERAAWGQLLFEPDQSERLRAGIGRRRAPESASLRGVRDGAGGAPTP